MDLGIRSKVFLIAGASRGLGYGIASVLAEEGALVSLGARDPESVRDAAAKLTKETGSTVRGYSFDAKDGASIQRWVEHSLADFGQIDGLLVNAGGPPIGFFDDFGDGDWQSAFELTLMSSVRMIRAVLPSLRKQGGGSIVTLTSSSVKEPIDNLLLSNVMRSGVVSLAKSLSRQLADENIRVNNLVPGSMYTDRLKSLVAARAGSTGASEEAVMQDQQAAIPLGRYGTIRDFGNAGAFLLSDAASYITGETLIVDGGSMKTVW